ncbi:MAG: efflux RND transporter permease subunit [Rikenellaceae bacterium]|nr:efflux RND transporter permease subunit [Rikenellaceae bacterium]
MKIYETSVRKPISTILIFIGVIVFGLFSLRNLSIDMYPDMDIPTITVLTTYQGANAADIETNVSRILEDNLNTVENLKKITSKSQDNISLVQLEFEWGSDLNEGANDIRDVIGRVQTDLPDEVETPMVFKFSSSMIPVIILYATAEESYPALDKILDEKLVNVLNRISGVGAVSLMGSPVREIQVNVDPKKIEAYNLSIEQIGQLIASENVDTPGGNLDIGQQTLSIRSMGEFDSSDQLKRIVITTIDGKQIYLSDVAEVKDTLEKTTLDERINGKLGVRIIVQKQSGANTVNIARDVTNAIEDIQKTLPSDVEIGVIIDTSDSIKNSINSLSETVMYAFIFVMIVVLFFLERWRATFIVVLTIPVSLIVSFIYLYVTGRTLNIISLSSLSIAIGMVVDDAIVVLENITKHIERGSSPREASIYATNEVWLAVIATTLVVVAVFMPLTMLSGMAGIMFRELGWIVSLVTVVSTIAAITLTPMLTSLMLRAQNTHTYKGLEILFKPIDKFLDWLDDFYSRLLTWSVRHRTFIVLLAVLIFVSSIFLLQRVPSEFYPKSDDGRISATVKLEQGVSVEYTMNVARHIDSLFKVEYPEIWAISTSAGTASSDNAFAAMQETGSHIINYTIKLTDTKDRDRSIFEIADLMREDFGNIAEINEYSVTAGGSVGGTEADISVKIFGYDFDITDALARDLQKKFAEVPGAADIQVSREEMRPELRIIYDREKLSYYGLTTGTVSSYVRNRINGLTASQYREDGDEYDIVVRYAEEFRTSVDDIENIIIYNSLGNPIKLKDVGKVVEELAPPTIEREDRQRVVSVDITLSGAAMSQVVAGIQEILSQEEIPEGVFIELGGSYEDQQDSFADLFTLLILIIVLVYIVMATQFESFRMPFIIMLSLPFAFTGVFLALYFTGTPLSIIALIGAIMLVGIVVKNGIVMVDFMNLLRDRGMSINMAVINAGKSRLRPVLMTTMTTILGMVPLAVGAGEGSEIWRPMGIAVIGGLTFSTVLTLIVIPVVYSVFGTGRLKRDRKKELKLIEEIN